MTRKEMSDKYCKLLDERRTELKCMLERVLTAFDDAVNNVPKDIVNDAMSRAILDGSEGEFLSCSMKLVFPTSDEECEKKNLTFLSTNCKDELICKHEGVYGSTVYDAADALEQYCTEHYNVKLAVEKFCWYVDESSENDPVYIYIRIRLKDFEKKFLANSNENDIEDLGGNTRRFLEDIEEIGKEFHETDTYFDGDEPLLIVVL